MLLGIGLHAAVPLILWRTEADGTVNGRLIDAFYLAIHGFRMPVFFLVSGFFTAMLWRRRGLGGLIAHRLRRIALPLGLSVLVLVPAILGAYALAAGISGLGERAIDVGVLDGFRLFHLWFLWHLLFLVAGFALAVGLANVLRRVLGRGPTLGPRGRLLALIALPLATLAPQLLMESRFFGPDTSDRLVPEPHVLAYYATFFAFGALTYGVVIDDGTLLLRRLGRGWWWMLPAALLVLFPVGALLTYDGGPALWPVASVVQVTYAWLCCLGLVGLFATILARERPWVRYLADASYWMYLVHFPLIVVAQGALARWAFGPDILWVALVSAAAFGLTLASYRSWVRYGVIGRLLNGAKARPTPAHEGERRVAQPSA